MGDLPESRDWGGVGGRRGRMGDCERERETYYSLEVKDVVGGGGGRAFLELRVVLWTLLVIFIFFV